jgi:hypothetical protein
LTFRNHGFEKLIYRIRSRTSPWRIRKSRSDRHLEQTTAMVPPFVVSKDGEGWCRLARTVPWSTAVERLMNAMFVVINPQFFQLSPVHGEFVNYAAIGIWNSPQQWLRQA